MQCGTGATRLKKGAEALLWPAGLMAASALIATPALGQIAQPPSASRVTPRDIAPPEVTRPSETSVEPAPPPTAAATAPNGSADAIITPSEVIVQGGLPDMADAERALAARHAGTSMTVADLYTLAARLEAAYARAGYIFARVVVPPQQLDPHGPAQIRVIDGFIEAVDLDKVPPRHRRPVRDALAPLVGRRGLTLATIERQLTIAGDLPGVRLRSTLIAGEQVGATRLVIDAQARLASGSISYDNRASGAFGGHNFNAQIAVNSLLGRGEQFYLFLSADPTLGLRDALASDAPRRVFGGGVTIPLGGDGLRITLENVHSITQPDGGYFLTRSTFNKLSGRLSYPVIRENRRSLAISTALEWLVERQAAPQFGVDLFRDRYMVSRHSLDYSHRGRGRVLTLSGSLALGFGQSPSTSPLSRAAATTRYGKVEADAQVTQALPAGFQAHFTLRGQKLIDGGVPNSELFSLDGQDALSPFTSGALSADEGLTTRFAVLRAIAAAPGVTITPGIYAAAGRGWFSAPTPFDINRARAFGATLDLALRPLSWAPQVRASLDYGRRKLPGRAADNHLFFAVSLGI